MLQSPPDQNPPQISTHPPGPLWNPMAAAWWSLLLSPLFGAILLDQNWRTLGQKESARGTRILIWSSIALLIFASASVFIDLSKSHDKMVQAVGKAAGIGLTAACFSIAKRQKRHIAESNSSDYQKRPLKQPLAFGSLILAGWFGLLFVGVIWFTHPALEDVAAETQKAMSTFFQQAPEHHVTAIHEVKMEKREGSNYFGVVELTSNGERVRQILRVRLEGDQLNWETQPNSPSQNVH